MRRKSCDEYAFLTTGRSSCADLGGDVVPNVGYLSLWEEIDTTLVGAGSLSWLGTSRDVAVPVSLTGDKTGHSSCLWGSPGGDRRNGFSLASMRQRASLIGLELAIRAMGGLGRGFSDSGLAEGWARLGESGSLT